MASTSSQALTVDSFTVGWIAPLPYERAASIAMLDERLEPPEDFEKSDRDPNQYSWGRIGKHHVAIASLPSGETGTGAAATTAASLLSSLPSVRIGILVGVGAGVPDPDHGYDIRLGDVVVSQPQGTTGGVVQYDLAKAANGTYARTGMLNMPPAALRAGLAKLQAEHEMEPSAIPTYLAAMRTKHPQMAKSIRNKPGYVYQGSEYDRYFAGDNLVEREAREDFDPEIHYGTIASGNTLIQNSDHRDQVLARLRGPEHIVCFDSEAAGLMNHFPCLVIRGICGYADGADNTMWDRYAAATAAAFAKELLGCVDSQDLSVTVRMGDLGQRIQNVQENVRHLAEHAAAVSKLSHDAEVLRWLCPADASINYNKARDQCQSGTGSWFLESKEYQHWKQTPKAFLWLHGKPGCGKTILSSTIIQDLCAQHRDTVIYFYFDFNDFSKQSFSDMVRSLIAQLYTLHPSARVPLDRLYLSCNNGRDQAREPGLVAVLHSMLEIAPNSRVVLDALDECKTEEQLLKWLVACQEKSLSMLVTSRKEHQIRSVLDTSSSLYSIVSIQQVAVDRDILCFVKSCLANKKGFQRWELMPEVLEEIETRLMEKAHGMFQWAACQVDVLEDCLDHPSLEDAITSLPRDLDETYARILSRIPRWHRRSASRLLQFLVWSDRPLRLDEAVDVIAVHLDRTPVFSERYRLPRPDEIARLCSSLVELTTENVEGESSAMAGNHGKSFQFLRLAHMSVKEYLMSEHVEDDFRKELGQFRARSSIVEVSLGYLTEASRLTVKGVSLPLSQFCARQWMRHARLLEHEGHLQDGVRKFFADIDAYQYWLQITEPNRPRLLGRSEGDIGMSHVQDACLGGLILTVERMVQEGADVNKQGWSWSPLQAASSQGHESVVRMLLDSGADINAQGGNYSSALQAAATEGHGLVARLLLDKGADVNARGYHGNSLQAASANGHERMVQLLLENGANVNATSGLQNDTALQAASAGGHESVVRLLLEAGANVNARGGYAGHALQAACLQGNRGVAELLLQNGANVNAGGGAFGSALQAACVNGDQALVRMLISHGADAWAYRPRQTEGIGSPVPDSDTIAGNVLSNAGGFDAMLRLSLTRNVHGMEAVDEEEEGEA